MSTGQIEALPSKRRLLVLSGLALAMAALIVLGAVMPAEFNRDPLGIGKATGLSRLFRETEPSATVGATLIRRYDTPFRRDTVHITLHYPGAGPYSLEYKVRMKRGATLVYAWRVLDPPSREPLYTEFHGHTIGSPQTMKVQYYGKGKAAADSGALIAPFDGIHGWFVDNQVLDRPITVELKLAGFYELIPPGAEGNEIGIKPDGIS